MPDQIVVGVESAERGRDFGSNAEAFRRFLEAELLPVLAARYRVAGRHTVIGHSLSGSFALDLLCSAPERYYGVVAVSPALDDSASPRLAQCAGGSHAMTYGSTRSTLRAAVAMPTRPRRFSRPGPTRS